MPIEDRFYEEALQHADMGQEDFDDNTAGL